MELRLKLALHLRRTYKEVVLGGALRVPGLELPLEPKEKKDRAASPTSPISMQLGGVFMEDGDTASMSSDMGVTAHEANARLVSTLRDKLHEAHRELRVQKHVRGLGEKRKCSL